MADGIVVDSEYLGDRWKWYLVIEHDNSFTTSYLHIDKPTLKIDSKVKKGNKIGTVAQMEDAHLHFSLSHGPYDKNEAGRFYKGGLPIAYKKDGRQIIEQVYCEQTKLYPWPDRYLNPQLYFKESTNVAQPQGPSMPFEDHGACPFECCTYCEWIANKDSTVQKDHRKESPIVFTVRKGEKVDGVTGIVITTKPGRAKVQRPVKIGDIHANPGDIVCLLTYRGEGFWKIWFQGRIIDNIDISGFVSTGFHGRTFEIIDEGQAIWWVQIKNRKGQVGWSDKPENFDNKDACG